MSGATALKAYPGCPTLSWMIASRVTNPLEDSDAFISFTGRKGSAKSTSSMSFCEAIAEDIAMLRGKGEPPSQFFDIDHVRSISELGAIELLSSGALKNENSVFLLDDTGTQWGARNFQSAINKHLNAILQICRVYKCVLVANFIMANHVDIQARQMTDYRAQMLFKNVRVNQAVFKFFYVEQADNGKEYKKYLTWKGKRITKWIIGRPSVELENAYKVMRRANTDAFIDDASEKLIDIRESKKPKGQKTDGRLKSFVDKPGYDELREQVLAIQNDPTLGKRDKSPTAIARKLKVTRHKVELAGDF